MNVLLWLTLGVLAVTGLQQARANEVLRELSWSALAAEGKLTAGEVVTATGRHPAEYLTLENRSGEARTFRVLDLNQPGITQPSYAIIGEVRYEQVSGAGYLELWNYLPGSKAFFSRTLGNSGPLQSLRGSSDWRPFLLPFYLRNEHGWMPDRPERLELNVVLPGNGTVMLGTLKLVQSATGALEPAGGGWWNARTSAWIGGIGGSILGILGGLVGALAGTGRARGIVLPLVRVLTVLGAACFAAGVVSVVLRQPYAVCYPLLLIGGVSALVFGCQGPLIRRRYEARELQQMKAMDA